MAARRERRALSQVGGPTAVAGDLAVRSLLSRALAVESDEPSTRAHVHGFHSYAARMHPLTARRLVDGLAPARGTVLDPFAGSGTVLVEARLAGRRAIGVDCNPLAIELAWLKTRGSTGEERADLVAAAGEVAAVAEERRVARAGPSKPYTRPDRDLFDVHVLLELDGLRLGLEKAVPAERTELRRALALVLSSILTKVSRQTGDTTDDRVPRRLASGFTIGLFVRRAEELARQLEAFAALVPPGAPPAIVRVGDARRLPRIRAGSVDLIVCSPPYPGIYDYFAQHQVRLRWLGFDSRAFSRSEIGARRKLAPLGAAAGVKLWEDELGASLAEMARALAPRGRAVLLLADSVLAGRAVAADELVARISRRAGLELAAVASQPRPHFHGPSRSAFAERPRREHALLLAR